MVNKDIFSVLFNAIEDDGLFDFDDAEKDELDSEVTVLDKRITKFIEKNLYPNKRKKLNSLLVDYNLAVTSYFHKESELFYKNGVATGIRIVIEALSMNMRM